MKGKARRLLSWVCVLALCMSLLPVTALAKTPETKAGQGTYEAVEFANIADENSTNGQTFAYAIWTDQDNSYHIAIAAHQDYKGTTLPDGTEVEYTKLNSDQELTVTPKTGEGAKDVSAGEVSKHQDAYWIILTLTENQATSCYKEITDEDGKTSYVLQMNVDIQGTGHEFDKIVITEDFVDDTPLGDPEMNPTANPIKIVVVLDGDKDNKKTGESVGDFIAVNPYKNTSDDPNATDWDEGTFHATTDTTGEAGTVTYSITYYDCKDIGFKAKEGYVIEDIEADLVYGQSGCYGIYDTSDLPEGVNGDMDAYGDYMADNVQGGSTVTVYVRTLYSAQFHDTNGDVISENIVSNLVTGWTIKESNSPGVTEPVFGGTYVNVCDIRGEDCADSDGDHVCDKHAPATADGKQQGFSFAYVVSPPCSSTVSMPSLPAVDDNYTASGWWLNDSSCADNPDYTVGGPPYTVSADDADKNRVIHFYSKSTVNTADYTVKYVFKDANGNVIPDTSDWTSDSTKFPQSGSATIGETVNLEQTDPALPKTVTRDDGNNYVLVDGNYSCEITAGANEIIVIYALDNWDDEDNTETGGDGTPDYQQALIKYVVAVGQSEYGQVDKALDVVTLEDTDNDDDYSKEVTATATATANTDYAFDYWMKDSSADWKGWSSELSDTFTAQGGKTYTYTANFAEDTNEDGIPDKYQVFVNFVSADDKQGTVFGTGTTQVFTLTDDNDNYVESGTITPVNTEITITPANGYAFDIWTEGSSQDAVYPFKERTVNGNTTITFYAHFDTDTIGGENPENPGDGTPDKYQATVIYNVKNGTFGEEENAPILLVYVVDTDEYVTEGDNAGTWQSLNKYVGNDECPIPKDMTPDSSHVEPGAWEEAAPSTEVQLQGNATYEYTFTFGTEVEKALSVTKELTLVDGEEYNKSGIVDEGNELTYTITVNNTGNVPLENVTVTDTLTVGDGEGVVIRFNESEGATINENGTATITSLDAKDSVTLTATYTVPEGTAGQKISNTAVAASDDITNDPEDSVEVTVANPDVEITKALTSATRPGDGDFEYNADTYRAQVGDELHYTITVKNTGNTHISVVVTDSLWGNGVSTVTVDDTPQDVTSDGITLYAIEPSSGDRSKRTITYTYTVQPDDISKDTIVNTANAYIGEEGGDPDDTAEETVRMDDYTVTITPADITIYTGGDAYGGVVDADGNIISTASGLPEPGYHIDLPAAVESWLQEHDVDLEESAANLAGKLAFQYFDESGDIIRNWDLENQGVYSRNSDETVSRYVYSLSPNTVVGENEGVQVRLAFTDDGNIVTTDNIWMNENTVSASYDMTIYGGGLQQSEIKAVFTAGDESITCTVKIGTGHLLVKSVTNEGTTTNGIEASSDTVDADTITAVADENVTYYVNDSEVKVENENDRVQLLVDEVSNGEEFNAAMGNDAVAKVNAALEEGNTLSNAAYDLAYMDLVDTQNGNTVVTMGEDQSLTIYWPVPEDAAEDSEFHVVHYTEMDRQDTTTEGELGNAATIMPETDTTTINGQKYVTFTTDSFSPFALVYEKAPDPVAKLEVTKTLTKVNSQPYTGGSVSVNDTLTYTITVKNGEVALKDVTITDTFTGKGDLNFTLPNGATVSENQDGIYTINLGTLEANATVTITATYKVLRADASSDLINAVKVNGTNPGGGEDPTDEDKTPETPVNPYRPPIRPPEDPDKPALNTEDHYAYIVGYEDGSVQPEGDITRAEVATIFFRLLTDESRNEYWSQTNPYSDVSADDWFNNAVSTLTNAGVLDGYEDGTFKPNGNITRAEFATITARFFEATYDGENLFPDIEGHWAQDYINEAANAGIVDGYPDGTFGPQKLITRAEAMTMVNRTIDRHPHEDHLLADMIVWPDNPETAWYYEQVQEATNSHEYTMNTDDEQNPYEIWTKLLPNRDWSELEKEWSDANDGAGSGEVV